MSNKPLTPSQQSLIDDVIEERKHDKKRKINKEVINGIDDLNARAKHYVGMFPDSLEKITLQTLNDYKAEIIVLQSKKIDHKKPVAITKGDSKSIYVDAFLNKEDLMGYDGKDLFTFQEPYKGE